MEALQVRSELDKLKQLDSNLKDEWKQDCLANYKQFLASLEEFTFLADFIDNQVTQSMATGAKQRKWSVDWIRFWIGFRHQPSARACLEYLQGAGNHGRTKYSNSNSNFNLHVPSHRLLDLYERPGYYPMPCDDEIKQLIARATSYAQEAGAPLHIISFDGVFAIPTYEHDIHTDTVVGGEKAYPSADFLQLTDEQLHLNHGREIVQFSLQNIAGGYVEPIGHWVMPHGKPDSWIIERLQELVAKYSSSGVYIIGSASDGDMFSLELELVMNRWNQSNHKRPWLHFFDYSHAVRNARNAFRRRSLCLPGTNCYISMKRLLDLRKTQPSLNDSILPPLAFNPDEMSMQDCMLLVNKNVIQVLDTIAITQSSSSSSTDREAAAAISKYLSLLLDYYNLMQYNTYLFTTKLE